MLSAIKVYFKLAWLFKTPFIFLMDTQYELLRRRQLSYIYNQIPNLSYIPEYRDCDNFAFIYKGIADKMTNAVGVVIGLAFGGLHCWNVGLCRRELLQIEPQTGLIFKKTKKYIPLIVIM